MLAHSAIERIDDPRAPSYTSYQLRLHKRARGIIQDNMDAIGFMATDLVIQSEDQGFSKERHRGAGGATRWLHWDGRPSFVARGWRAVRLPRLDVGRPDHLAPLFGVCRDEHAEVGGRPQKRRATQFGKSRLDFGVNECSVDLPI